jgi:hypothetical protein
VYPHLVAWEGVGENTERRYSDCLLKILQKASEKRHIVRQAVIHTLLFTTTRKCIQWHLGNKHINKIKINRIYYVLIQDAWVYGLRAITLIDILPFIGRAIGEEGLAFHEMICKSQLGNEV